MTLSLNITNLETRLLSISDELSNELLNIEDVIIKNLQFENKRLKEELTTLESKVVSLETSQNMLEQYGRKNKIEISGIPDYVSKTH